MHAYEIGTLSEQEREKFEIHLLACEHCASLLEAFETQASLLVTSSKVMAVVDEVMSEKARTGSWAGKFLRHLWPEVPLVFKPAVAYLVVLLLAIPAYYGLRDSGQPTVSELGQVVHLSPVRSAAKTLAQGISDNGLLTFEFDGYRPGSVYSVTIESEDGTVVYCNDQFSSFNEREIGSLDLRISEMRPGQYRLIISEPPSDSATVSQEYLFRIKE